MPYLDVMFHSHKLMRKLYLIIFLVATFVSCAPLGTSTNLYQYTSIKAKKIGFYTFELDYPDKLLELKTDSIFKQNLIKEIQELTGLVPEFLGYLSSDSDFERVKSTNHDYELILVSQLQLTEMFNLGATRRFNTTIRTFLIEEKSKAPIIETKFNTNMGKTYWRHPVLETAIRDGVNGAIRPYRKKGIF
jgi:hypothetical protein